MNFGGVQVLVSDQAVRRWTEKRLRHRDYVWRGRNETEWYIVTVQCQEPAMFRMGGRLIVHPKIYANLKAAAELKSIQENDVYYPGIRQFTDGMRGERIDVTTFTGEYPA